MTTAATDPHMGLADSEPPLDRVKMALDIISFYQGDIGKVLKSKLSSEIDKPALGAVQLASLSKVLQYKQAEGDVTGRDPAATIKRI